MKKSTLMMTTVLSSTLLLAGCGAALWSDPVATASPAAQVTGLNLTPGVYNATIGTPGGEGAEGIMEINLTVDHHSIVALEVVYAADTAEIQAFVLPELVPLIVAGNTTALDAITGGSVTSERLLRVVEDALTQAGADIGVVRSLGTGALLSHFDAGTFNAQGSGNFNSHIDLDVTFDVNGITGIELLSVSQAPRTAANAWEVLTDRALTAGSPNIDVVSGATHSSLAFIAALESAAEQAILPWDYVPVVGIGQGDFDFTPGSYTATVEGAHGPFSVTIETTEDTIIEITLDHVDTRLLVNRPLAALIDDVLANQAITDGDIFADIVSGASISGEAFREGLAQAIELATN